MEQRYSNSKLKKSYIKIGLWTKKILAIFFTIAILNLNFSCSYFTVRNTTATQETVSSTIKEFNDSEKYVIIHSNDLAWNLVGVVINEDDQTLSGNIRPVSEEHIYKHRRETKRVHKYSRQKTKPLNEVHFYLKSGINFAANKSVTIPLSDIASVSVNDPNVGRSIANIALGTVGTIFVAMLLYAALKSSCPFVYIKNGEEFDFVGELYPGVITSNMQTDNYLPLPNFTPENNEYLLKISNHLKEVQYTDQVQLITVNHEKDIEVILDSKGEIQTFRDIESPIKAIEDGSIDNIKPALKKDGEFYAFNTPKSTKEASRNIVFEFEKQENVEKAKLYLTVKNSVWLDYIFGKFNEQFGYYYKTFQKKQQKVKGDSINAWTIDQHIPLSIYKKTKNEWELIERISTVGPLAMRDLAIPFSLNDVEGEKLQIKIETGFMFWEVDFVGIDYSKNEALELSAVEPTKAIDQKGNNVVNLLLEADKNYFVQPNIGDEVLVHFQANACEDGFKQSVFLKNRGYYNYIRDYKGVPNFEKLSSFKEPHTFTKFSEKAYLDFVNFNNKTLAYHE